MLTGSIIPTHKAAVWLLTHIDRLLDALGLERSPALEEILYLAVIILVALAIGWLVRVGIVWTVRRIVRIHDGAVGRELLSRHIFQKCSHFIPPLVFLGLVPLAVVKGGSLVRAVDRLAAVYAVVTITYGLSAVLSFIFDQINRRHNQRHLPLRGILNVILGILWIVTAIIGVSLLLDKSPATLLAGLGAFAAALMLIFKDSILGFVAGLQMSENDMVHVGDWILVPGTPANGIVRDVSLSTVKIQNFDNTMVMVPPYTLVSKGFQNYRYMQETHARRIMVNIVVDSTTVAPLASDTLRRLSDRYTAVRDFAARAAATSDGWICDQGNYVVNGTTETNLGLFRAYVTAYFSSCAHISKDQMIMARLLDPTTDGYVLQIYAFADTAAWVAFEGIKSAVIEHLTAVMPDFGLAMYASASLDVDIQSMPSEESAQHVQPAG